MKKFLQKKLKNEKGLTLVELLAVIVILGIIAAIAVPSIGNIIENSRFKAIKGDAQTILSAANMYYAESDTKTDVTLPMLKEKGFINDSGAFKIDDEKVIVTYKSGGNTFTGTGKSGSYSLTITGLTSKGITDMSKPAN
ncbi:type II secretion system protein [Sporosarcina sp. D27]|uniref:type II secretion system protein n=1 Tax=Sporosarcina sp. D27 TaxID=1382305 RepID=UPI0004709256|nr:type II secretion system protein [Sporosarcina sp. D27]